MRPGRPVCCGVIATLVIGAGGCSTPTDQLEQYSAQNRWLQQNQASVLHEGSAPPPALKPVTHFAAGQLFENQKLFSRAIAQYSIAVDLNPKFIAAHNRIGICLDHLGQHGKAEEVFRKAILLDPELSHLRNNLAFNLMVQHRWTDAESELREALFLKPGYQRARTNLGIVLAKQSRDAEALASFRIVLGEALAHYNMGLLLKTEHRYAAAAEAFRQAVTHEPRLTAAKVQLEDLRKRAQARDRTVTPKLTWTTGNSAPVRTISTPRKILEPVDDGKLARTQVDLQPAPNLPEEPVARTDAQVVEIPELATPLAIAQAAPTVMIDQPVDQSIDSAQGEFVDEDQAGEPDAFVCLELPSATAHQIPVEHAAKVEMPEPMAVELPAEILPAAIAKPELPQLAGLDDRTPSVLEPPALPSLLPVMLCNEPCDVVGMLDRLASLQEQLKPCSDGEYVDQFFLEAAGYEPEPVAALPAAVSPPSSNRALAASDELQAVSGQVSQDSSSTQRFGKLRDGEPVNHWSLKQQFGNLRGSSNLFYLGPPEAFQSSPSQSRSRLSGRAQPSASH